MATDQAYQMESKDMEAGPNVRFEGRPTGPDVDEIVRQFPAGMLTPDTVITYDSIAETVNVSVMSHRFKTVTNAWRKRMFRLHNIFIVPGGSFNFIVATGNTRVDHSSHRVAGGLRKIVRGGEVAKRTSPFGLTAENLRTRDHIVRVSAQLKGIADVAARDLTAEFKAALKEPGLKR